MAQQAYRGLQQQNQSILVSGESGAGKTETVKLCMQFLSEYGDPTITERILYANPILEAFGNAATERNDNSSRFGKFLTLQFDEESRLVGGRCDIYLLEKVRVVGPAPGERNFHILYQVAATADSNSSSSTFKCLTETQQTSDALDYATTLTALNILGICGENLQAMEQALWIVLHLSNVVFRSDDNTGDRAHVKDETIHELATLLGVESTLLANALTNQTMHAGKDSKITIPLRVEQAFEGCHAFAKEVYAQTFQWLVDEINETTSASKETRSIGILDIFGFESFEENRFEQLCINYANEVLQNKFAEDVFQSLLIEFREEEIDLGVGYETNSDVLELLSGGVLRILSEECIRPQGNDVLFVRKLNQSHGASPRFVLVGDFHQTFSIRHFAETVVYNAERFIETNRDRIPSTVISLCAASTNYIVNRVAQSQAIAQSLVKNTVLFKFNKQLVALMKSLNSTRTLYIRCIKPNLQKEPLKMDHRVTLRQLRSSGVVAAVKIARSAFPSRMDYCKILKRYRCFGAHVNSSAPTKVQVMYLLVIAMRDFEGPCDEAFSDAVLLGKTRAYFRLDALEYLEQQRNVNIKFFALTIQSLFRGFVTRQYLARLNLAATRIASHVRSFRARTFVKKMPSSALRIQRWYRSCQARHGQCLEANRSIGSIARKTATIKIQKGVRHFLRVKNLRSFMKRQQRVASLSIRNQRAIQTEQSKDVEYDVYKKENKKLLDEISHLKVRSKELALENTLIKTENAQYKSANDRLQTELRPLKGKELPAPVVRRKSSIPIRIERQESPEEYSMEQSTVDTTKDISDVSWFSSTEMRTKLSSQSSSINGNSHLTKAGRRSTFLRSTLFTPSLESSFEKSEVSAVEKRYKDLMQDYKTEQERNRRLAETNESMQAVLFELNEGMGQLSKTNRDLREVIDHYRSIFAGESNQKQVERFVSVPVVVDHPCDVDQAKSVVSETSFSDSTLPSLSPPDAHGKAHFTFELSASKSIFGVNR